MNSRIYWKRRLLSDSTKLYVDSKLVGELRTNYFKRYTYGEINGHKFQFKTKGLFKQHTEVVDCKTNNVIGKIKYNGWFSKATIHAKDNLIIWEYINFWRTKWLIYDSNGNKIKFYGNLWNGQIISNINNPLLLLLGLYVPIHISNWIKRS